MKRIVMIAPGSRGDVQPYLALGKGLKDAGNEVRFVSHNNFESLVIPYGLDFYPVNSNVQDIVESQTMRDLVEKGNFLLLMAQMAKEAEQAALDLTAVALAACQRVDLILGGMGGVFTGIAVAEKLRLPFLQAYLVPFTPTRDFPGALVPGLPGFARGLWRVSHHLARQVLWQSFRSADARSRKEILGLPPAPLTGPYSSPQTRGVPILYGFSPAVIPQPGDWGADIHITGYWFLDEDAAWMPPADLSAFLKDGPAPVYIGFGSMSNRNPEQTADLVIEALKRAGQRAILLSGWGGLQKGDLPENILMTGSVSHSWLFPHMAAVVHHGGAGTTAAGLRAGVPNVVIPFFGDQPFWARRVADLGVGPQPIPRAKLSVERLANAIQLAVNDAAMRQRASDLGARIRAEDGIARAVEIIAQIS